MSPLETRHPGRWSDRPGRYPDRSRSLRSTCPAHNRL